MGPEKIAGDGVHCHILKNKTKDLNLINLINKHINN